MEFTCIHCQKQTTKGNIKKHEKSCYLNPLVRIDCQNCGNPIKDYKHSKGTCSRSCANTHFKSGESNGNWKGTKYQTICFTKHKKQCIICKEDKIVAVHHYNEDHNDDRIENLVPLCPTHHSYMHSRYVDEIKDRVDKYVEEFTRKLA